MEKPEKDIADVIALVSAGPNPEVQKESILKYYAKDVYFSHPLCTVAKASNSRDSLVRVLQSHRVVSKKQVVEIASVTYDHGKNELFVDVVRTLFLRGSPFDPLPSRALVHMKLRREPSPDDGDKQVYVIEEQEDLLRVEDVVALFAPPLVPLARMFMQCITWLCVVTTATYGALGLLAAQEKDES